jgi:TRAP-type C4-dicarboxylate transport system substrate-binding protein
MEALKRFMFFVSVIIFGLSIFIGSSLQSAVAADKITLRGGWGFPAHSPFGTGHKMWADKIEKDSNGQLVIEHYWGGALINMRDSYNELKRGVGDVCEVTGNYVKEGFHIEKAMSLIFYGIKANADEARIIYEKLCDKYPEIMQEWSEVKPVSFFSPPAADLLSRKTPVRKVEDIKGLTLKTSGDLTRVINALAGQGARVPLGETYMAMQKGTIDGALSSAEAVKTFRFAEVIKYYTILQMPLWPSPHVAMNLDKYNNLPPNLQKVIDDNIDFYGNTIAEQFDIVCDAGFKLMKEKGVEIIELPKAEINKIYDVTEQVVMEQAKRIDKMGLPGTKIAKDAITLKKEYFK